VTFIINVPQECYLYPIKNIITVIRSKIYQHGRLSNIYQIKHKLWAMHLQYLLT